MPWLVAVLPAIASAAGSVGSALGGAASTAAGALGSLGSAIGSGAEAAGSAIGSGASSLGSGLESALGIGSGSATQGMSAADTAALSNAGVQAVGPTTGLTDAESSLMLGGQPYSAMGGAVPGTTSATDSFAAQGANPQAFDWSGLYNKAAQYGLGGSGSGGGGGGPGDMLSSILTGGFKGLTPPPQQPPQLAPMQMQPITGDDPSAWIKAFRAMG